MTEDPRPAGEYEHRGWTVPYWNDEIAKWQTDQLFSSDALLLGRTYEEFVVSWPLRSGDPGDVVEAVSNLKEQPGRTSSSTAAARS